MTNPDQQAARDRQSARLRRKLVKYFEARAALEAAKDDLLPTLLDVYTDEVADFSQPELAVVCDMREETGNEEFVVSRSRVQQWLISARREAKAATAA